MIYECTAMVEPGEVTVWTGTAFDCPYSGNEIILLHRHFLNHAYGSCNNGAIEARFLSVKGNNYTSQLNVTVTPDTAGKTIECLHDNGTAVFFIFSLMIPLTGMPPYTKNCCCHYKMLITQTGPFSSPNKLYTSIVDLSLQEIAFSWSPVAPDCPAIHYNILASNCGSCPNTTNHTNVTCTDVPTDGSVCIFGIRTVVCGNITSTTSDPISIVLYATESTIRTPTGILRPTENQSTPNSDTTETVDMLNSAINIISFSSLAVALTASVVASVTVIAVILVRSRAKIKALELQLTNSSTDMEPMYEEATGPLPSASAISTQDNVAYGHTQILTTTTQT